MKIPEDMVAAVRSCAREAAKEILMVYNRENIKVSDKLDKSPLTEADRKANQLICRFLERHFAEIPIISEENKSVPYEERKHYEQFWLVDPLDGTKEFIKRNGEFTVNIALVVNGSPELGVVYVPVTDTMYWGAKGHGAHFQADGKAVKSLKVNAFRITDPGLRVVCSRSHPNGETERYIQQLKNPELRSKGSSLKFMLIAQGDAELYPRLAPTMEWDTAAAQCILEQAGGAVIEFDTNERLRYNKESLLNPSFIAKGRMVE